MPPLSPWLNSQLFKPSQLIAARASVRERGTVSCEFVGPCIGVWVSTAHLDYCELEVVDADEEAETS